MPHEIEYLGSGSPTHDPHTLRAKLNYSGRVSTILIEIAERDPERLADDTAAREELRRLVSELEAWLDSGPQIRP